MVSNRKLSNYFKQAYVVAENSPDSQRKVGSLLIHTESGSVIASGYNGFIRKSPDNLPTTRPEKTNYIIHSEINLLLNCVRLGIKSSGCFVVVTTSPCIHCLRSLYQADITTIYFKEEYKDFKNQLNMLDLKIEVTDVGEFKQILLTPRR